MNLHSLDVGAAIIADYEFEFTLSPNPYVNLPMKGPQVVPFYGLYLESNPIR